MTRKATEARKPKNTLAVLGFPPLPDGSDAMTSNSGTGAGSALGSLTSYCTQLLAAKATAEGTCTVDASGTDDNLTAAVVASPTPAGGTCMSSEAGALSTLIDTSF